MDIFWFLANDRFDSCTIAAVDVMASDAKAASESEKEEDRFPHNPYAQNSSDVTALL
jgi:hypothetical protein